MSVLLATVLLLLASINGSPLTAAIESGALKDVLPGSDNPTGMVNTIIDDVKKEGPWEGAKSAWCKFGSISIIGLGLSAFGKSPCDGIPKGRDALMPNARFGDPQRCDQYHNDCESCLDDRTCLYNSATDECLFASSSIDSDDFDFLHFETCPVHFKGLNPFNRPNVGRPSVEPSLNYENDHDSDTFARRVHVSMPKKPARFLKNDPNGCGQYHNDCDSCLSVESCLYNSKTDECLFASSSIDSLDFDSLNFEPPPWIHFDRSSCPVEDGSGVFDPELINEELVAKAAAHFKGLDPFNRPNVGRPSVESDYSNDYSNVGRPSVESDYSMNYENYHDARRVHERMLLVGSDPRTWGPQRGERAGSGSSEESGTWSEGTIDEYAEFNAQHPAVITAAELNALLNAAQAQPVQPQFPPAMIGGRSSSFASGSTASTDPSVSSEPDFVWNPDYDEPQVLYDADADALPVFPVFHHNPVHIVQQNPNEFEHQNSDQGSFGYQTDDEAESPLLIADLLNYQGELNPNPPNPHDGHSDMSDRSVFGRNSYMRPSAREGGGVQDWKDMSGSDMSGIYLPNDDGIGVIASSDSINDRLSWTSKDLEAFNEHERPRLDDFDLPALLDDNLELLELKETPLREHGNVHGPRVARGKKGQSLCKKQKAELEDMVNELKELDMLHMFVQKIVDNEFMDENYDFAIPNCQEDGSYVSKQCSVNKRMFWNTAKTGKEQRCWCVDTETGQKISGAQRLKIGEHERLGIDCDAEAALAGDGRIDYLLSSLNDYHENERRVHANFELRRAVRNQLNQLREEDRNEPENIISRNTGLMRRLER